MENKTTSELLDLLWKLENADEDKQDWNKYDEVRTELDKRPPFNKIFESDDANDPAILEKVDELIGDVKLLKRHKHDEKSGDVMVRI
jgi:hypothetical protein